MTIAPNGAAIVYESHSGMALKLLERPETYANPPLSEEDMQMITTSLSVLYASNSSIHDASDVLALLVDALSQGMFRYRM
jgi:hypothetical protein